nr:reverse transcriptase domain-containing protein [Tanacetum cinerariifolium]
NRKSWDCQVGFRGGGDNRTRLGCLVAAGIGQGVGVPLILGRPFLRIARALIDVHGEEMILRNRDERLTLNMKHDTASYSNHPHRDSVNLIDIFNFSSEDCLEDLVSNKQSGNPTFLIHKEIASLEVIHEIHDSKGCTFLSEEFPDIDSFNDIHPHFDDDPLSEDSIDQTNLTNCDDLFVDPTPEMFTDEQPPNYSFPPRFDVYPDDFLEIESDANNCDNDSFDSKVEKIKESELLIDQVDLPCDNHSEYDSFASQDFSRDDDLPSPDNEDNVFNPRILIHEKSVKIITRVAQEKKLAVSYASLLFEYFDPPFYELLVFKEVPNLMRLLPFSSENEEKVFKPGIYTSKKIVHAFLKELIGKVHGLQVPLPKLSRFEIALGELEITSSGWPFVFAIPGHVAHLVASITLDSARSCVMQGAFLTQGTVSSIPTVLSWGGSIRPKGLLSSVMLWLVIIVAVIGGGVTVVDVVESSSVVKLSFVIT